MKKFLAAISFVCVIPGAALAQGGDAAAGQHAGEKVVDAEFEDVDDKSKKNH